MASALWASRERTKLSLLGLGLVAVVGATAYSQVRLNAWNQPFYNALARKDMQVFIEQLGVFAVLAGVLLILNVAQMWLNHVVTRWFCARVWSTTFWTSGSRRRARFDCRTRVRSAKIPISASSRTPSTWRISRRTSA